MSQNRFSSKFISSFNKELHNLDLNTDDSPPQGWYSFGNYGINKIMTGSFFRGVPHNRMVGLAGASGAGKSYLLGNVIRSAQEDGAFCIIIDSERALSSDFMESIGVDTKNNYQYSKVILITEAAKLLSKFFAMYNEEYPTYEGAPPVLIAIDSLDNMQTNAEDEAFQKKGELKTDQGLRAKQIKQLLRTCVHGTGYGNISIVATMQPYKAKLEDIQAGEGRWVITESKRFAFDELIVLSKLKLRDGKDVTGIRMRAEGYKTRFSKPFQKVEVEVPYDRGMDALSGVLDILKSSEIVHNRGAWYYNSDETIKFQKKDFDQYALQLMKESDDQIGYISVISDLKEDTTEFLPNDVIKG